MNGRAFTSGVERLLLSLGFERVGKSLVRHDADVWTLVAVAKRFGSQWSINVGFWLDGLGGPRPDRVEQAHLYFRLERLVPDHHEVISVAGALEDSDQPKAYEALLTLLPGIVDTELRKLGTEAGLRDAMMQGRLAQGLVRKEARERLMGSRSGQGGTP